MKTQKITAEAKRVTTITITFEIEGKKVHISEQNARAIYNELGKLFGQHNRDWLSHPKYPLTNVPKWPV